MRVRGFNNVERAAQTDPKLLRYALTITKQKKCWEMLAQKFDRFQTLRTPNNMQQGVQTDATCIIQQCWELLARKVLSFCTGLYLAKKRKIRVTGLNRLPRDFQPIVCNALGCKEDTSIARRQKTKKTSENITLWCPHLVGKSSHRLVLT